MSIVLRKNLDFRNLCRWRLYLKSFPKEYNTTSKLSISYPKSNFIKESKPFATVAQGVKFNNDYGNREHLDPPENAGLKTVDEALDDIDYLVQRTGRTIRKSVERILTMIEDNGYVSNTQGLYLLRACTVMYPESPPQRVELAEQIWKTLQGLGCQFEVGHFNSLLRVYVENNHPFSPSEFLSKMESQKVEPNKATFLCLLDKYANDGNINGASEVLQFMKDKGLPINEAVFNALIKCHMKAKDSSGARDILEVMRSSCSPSAETFTALACGYVEMGETKEIASIVQEAKSNNTPLSTVNYLTIISSLPAEKSEFVDEILGVLPSIYNYKHEVLNCIYTLIHKDFDNIAFKLLLSISSREDTTSTNNVAKLLIKLGKPIEQIIEYCEKIHTQQLNEYIFINSAKAAVEYNKPEHAMALFNELYKKGIPVRVVHFWGLLRHYRNSEEGVWFTLNQMYKFGVPPDFITFEEYVFPAINVNNVQEVISKLQGADISLTSAIDPLFQYYCHNGDVDNALYLIENYPVRVYSNFNLEKFLALFDRFRFNTNTFYKILNHIMRKNTKVTIKEAEANQGKLLAVLIQNNPGLFQSWIKRFREEKSDNTFSLYALETCWRILNKQAPECLVYLRAFQRSQSPQTVRVITSEQEDEELSRLKGNGIVAERYMIDRLRQHIKDKNIDRVNQLTAKLEEMEANVPAVLCAQLINMYCEANDLDSAEKALCTLKEKYPNFKVETLKLFDYAALLIKFSKYEEAKKLVAENCQELQMFGTYDNVYRGLRRLFHVAIQTGDCDLVQSLQNSLMHLSKEFPTSTFLFEPLLRLHLHRQDIDSVVKEFRNCVKNHKVVPCLNMVLKKCITTDEHNLKTVISLASELKQENAILHELALAFLETGRKAQAVKVVQSLNERVNPVFVEDICNRLYTQKQVTELEDILHIFSNIDHLGKEKLYYNLFKLYDERNDHKKCLELYQWIEKKQLFDPSDRMKAILAKLLKSNGQVPPFSDVASTSPPMRRGPQEVNDFLECVNNKNTSEALEKIASMKKGAIQSISSNDIIEFIDLLVQDKRTTDLNQNNVVVGHIIENVVTLVKPLLEKYAENGDIESMKEIARLMPDFALRKIFFNTHYAKAHKSSGKFEELLCELENNQLNKTNKLFSITAYEELLRVPTLEDRLLKLAKGYLEDNFDLPMCVIWAHHVVNENYEKAKEILESYPVSSERVDTIVVKAVRRENNIHMGKVYLEAINQQNSRIRSKERAYGALLEVFVLKGLNDDAVALFTEAKEKGVNLEKYYRSTLITLKSALEAENKEVPFTILSENSAITG